MSYALVDCNNFYVSCEVLFQPRYRGKPAVVLSNNDGCAIARSEEAKALGFDMAAPIHLMADLVKRHNVKIFSSNYTLYGDMSRRVYGVLGKYSAHVENYSIDESFLYLGNMPFHSLEQTAHALRLEIKTVTGIPVTVGIAPTKTLAKLANRYAKKNFREAGVYHLDSRGKIEEVLKWADITEVWGIGRQQAAKLKGIGVHTAHDLTLVNEEWIRKNMTVVGQRMQNELRGVPSVKFVETVPNKKGICTSHSFGKLVTEKKEVREAVATFASRCALKLRQQGSCAGSMLVFLDTNQHRTQDQQYFPRLSIQLPTATASTNLLVVYAMNAVDIIYKPGINYLRAGVFVTDLVPKECVQTALWDQADAERNTAIMKVFDAINAREGKETLRFAAQGFNKRWKLRCEHLSKRYTTRIEEVVRIQTPSGL